ncbi:MAG TPA: DPP IV N-terminal domain-containing protein, partial [Bacteroidia bacterium]
HSTRENYYIWERGNKKLTPISKAGKQSLAEFSPDGSKVAFTRENNIFFIDLSTGKETQITSDGKVNNIINGSTDWVYEEEFAFDKAWYWSPDGNKIAFYRFDESNVKEFSMNKYGALYPTEYQFKYPKAGEENSKVDIFVYDLKEASRIKIDLGNAYEYIPRIKWTNNSNSLSVQRMNRLQNKLELLLADASSGKTNTILTETSDTYVEVSDNLTFLPNGKEFIWSSDKDGYNHLYLYDITGQLVYQITKGNWDVISFLGYDNKTQSIFYTSSYVSAYDKTLFKNKLDGSNQIQLYPLDGTDEAEFSATFSYYILTHSSANRPPQISIFDATGKSIRSLEENNNLLKTLNDYSLTTKEFIKIKTSGGTELNAWMMKPKNFDEKKKYPVLMYVYGGPGINTVNNSWDRDMMWYQMLCQKGYVIVSVDNRGTGGRGKKFRDCTYKQLGKLETEDQIDAAKYLGTLPYIDPNRIGIWGWSYGGYMSSLCITKGSDVFKMAMAVAPV